MNLDDALKNLENWTQSLPIAVKSTVPQVKEVFEPGYKLMSSCPSKEAAALMCLGQVENVIEELAGAIEIIKKAIEKAEK